MEGLAAKRKQADGVADQAKAPGPPAKVQAVGSVPLIAPPCTHEVALPSDYQPPDGEREAGLGDIHHPQYSGPMAKEFPFKLDAFQQMSISCLERRESVLVSAHTSAGKTAVAEYAIAMAFRDKQRVIYTSPIKALSNQKYRELETEFGDVGLMTGDVTISPNAGCIVMTTEIMRSMLYRGSEVMREVAWVIFDEIHYMKDRERGVVWEESIIFLPPAVKMVFLSATMSNTTEFAEWICAVHNKPCHVVYTDRRPVPLQHYAFPVGGAGLYLVVDEKGNFRDENFTKLLATFGKDKDGELGSKLANGGKITDRPPPKRKGAPEKTENKDIIKIIKMIKERRLHPVIVFSFARRELELLAADVAHKLDFSTAEEAENIEQVFNSAIQCLSEEDRAIDAVAGALGMLKKGVAIHHSGLLPIIKEIVELLFQEGLVKVLFATETFAMGLNMPAKTVVFTQVRKWDGEGHRYMSSGEYIQMSGRAGRRGKDDKGITITMVDDQMDMPTCKEMMLGRPAPLESTFKLSYYTLLNLMSRADGQFGAEHAIRHSFLQFLHEKKRPKLEADAAELERQSAAIVVPPPESADSYKKLRVEIAALEKLIMAEVLRPDRCLHFMRPGRLIQVHDGVDEWGWGVVVSVVKRTPPAANVMRNGSIPAPAESYMADTLLYCAPDSGRVDRSRRPKPRPCSPEEEGEMQVIPVQLTQITAVSSLRVTLPGDLRPAEARRMVLQQVRSMEQRFPDGLPRLDPIEDMGIRDDAFLDAVQQLQDRETELLEHPLFKSGSEAETYAAMQKKAQLDAEAAKLKLQTTADSQLHLFRDELRNRGRVLKRLGHINGDGVVQLKGRAACQIDTADELLVTELMFNGVFTRLDAHQIAAVASCFMQMEKSNKQVNSIKELHEPLSALRETAAHVATVQEECKIEIDVDEYADSFKPFLMDAVYAWSKGAKFSEVIKLTDNFEGSLIRAMRRLDELLNQLRTAAKTIGDENLEEKFQTASDSIRRGIVFANSLYV